ncbi:MAG: NRDE family protein [Desulfobacteraceae bacterium]|nr:MAG: NRDE family protein [Desulfobacteraceae bacterium]
MCLIVIAIQSHPDYPLVIAANRDEFYHRPTAPLSFWEDSPDLLAGRDLQGHGTWLGVTTGGRLAAITNFRDPKAIDPRAISRGLLVSNFLASDISPEAYLKTIAHSRETYSGFNLVAGNILNLNRDLKQRLSPELWWYSNKKKNDILPVNPGIHAISNHLIDTPWPKTRKATDGIRKILASRKPVDPEHIFNLLADTRRPQDTELPDTGVGLEWERLLSPVFVISPAYGTRSSAVILVDRSGRLTFFERTFSSGVQPPDAGTTREFEIRL